MRTKYTYKVGDQVRSIPHKAYSRSGTLLSGKICTVIEVSDNERYVYVKEELDVRDTLAGIWVDEVELVSSRSVQSCNCCFWKDCIHFP